MRNLAKLAIPDVLAQNAETWTQELIEDPNNATKRYRYRHGDIKSQLRSETSDKCVYCESKIGHNTPGDVEHKTPSAADLALHFYWGNLTIACTECNRRKNDYFDAEAPFIDPYEDDVEQRVVHHGPIVGWLPGDERAEVSVRTLELHDDSRMQLLRRKIERISEVNDILARLVGATSETLRELLRQQLIGLQSADAEYSAMVKSVTQSVNGLSNDQDEEVALEHG